MSESRTAAQSDAAIGQFYRETGRYGSITMVAAMLLALAAPVYLVFAEDLGITASMAWTAFVAVLATFGVIAWIEPITYYPVLGPAAMYQAFMIGNISNKLLPSAIAAQTTIDAKPGTHRADIAAVAAICGAAVVHLLSLTIFVGLPGTWLVSLVPADVVEMVRLFILPSLLGAVFVQTVVAMRNLRATLVAVVVGIALHFALIPSFEQLAPFATAIAVGCTILFSWIVRDRSKFTRSESEE